MSTPPPVRSTRWQPRRWLSLARRQFLEAIPRSGWEVAFDGVVLTYIVFVTYLTVARFWSFDSRGWDLGVYTQVYVQVSRLHALPTLPHFSPIIWLFAPLIASFPSATTLLVIQAAVVGGSGFPVFWLATHHTGRKDLAFVVGTAYLFSFLPLSIAWTDFHVETFLPLFFLAALYARQRFHNVGYVVACLLALASIEFAVALMVVLSIGLAVSARWSTQGTDATRSRDRRLARWTLLLSLGWLVGAYAILFTLSRFHGGSSQLFGGSLGLTNLGGPSVLQFQYVIGAQVSAGLTQLHTTWGHYALYLILIFGAFGFLSFFGDWVELLPASVWVVYALVAGGQAGPAFGDQYPAYVIPFVAAAACSALGRLVKPGLPRPTPAPDGSDLSYPVIHRPSRRARSLATLALVVLVGGLFVTSCLAYPTQSSPLRGSPLATFGWPSTSQHDAALHAIIGLLPRDARVLTTNNLFPEVAADPNAMLTPISPVLLHHTNLTAYIASEVARAQYILLDFQGDWSNAAPVQIYGNLSAFSVIAADSGVRLLERGILTPATGFVSGESFAVSPYSELPGLAYPIVSPYGPALFYPAAPTNRSAFLWTGPYLQTLAPATFDLVAAVALTTSVSAPSPLPAFTLKVVRDGLSLNATYTSIGGGLSVVDWNEVPAFGNQTTLASAGVSTIPRVSFQNVVLQFNWTEPGFLEVVGVNPQPDVSIQFLGATLTAVNALP